MTELQASLYACLLGLRGNRRSLTVSPSRPARQILEEAAKSRDGSADAGAYSIPRPAHTREHLHGYKKKEANVHDHEATLNEVITEDKSEEPHPKSAIVKNNIFKWSSALFVEHPYISANLNSGNEKKM